MSLQCVPAGADLGSTGFGYTMSLISGKYKLIILYILAECSVVRYNALKRHIGSISHKTLSLALKELEADGLYSFDEEETFRPRWNTACPNGGNH